MTTAQKTRCPHCRSAFRVTPPQLDAASGIVRCGVCFKTFDAIEHLESETASRTEESTGDYLIDDNFDLSLLEKDRSQKVNNRRTTPEPDTGKNIGNDETQTDSLSQTMDSAAPVSPPEAPTESPPAHDRLKKDTTRKAIPLVPSLNEEEETLTVDTEVMANWRPESSSLIDSDRQETQVKSRRLIWLWPTGSALAFLLLLVQLIYFNSLSVPRGSTFWPLTKSVCAMAGCPLQAETDSTKIFTGDLMVRTHPRVANALFVDAVILNQSDFSQPFPELRLIFENLQGAVIAQRVFSPRDYLEGEMSNATLMPSKRPVKLELEILDPGKDAVSFRLLVEP